MISDIESILTYHDFVHIQMLGKCFIDKIRIFYSITTFYFLINTSIIQVQISFTNCGEARKKFKFNSRSRQLLLNILRLPLKRLISSFSGLGLGSKKAKKKKEKKKNFRNG